MIWFNSWGNWEKTFLVAFVFLYLLYMTRVWFLSRKHKLDMRNLLKKFFLRTAYFSLILVAILGPTFGDAKKEISIQGKDIYFMVDASLSMATKDVAPSRLELSKACLMKINNLISSNDRVTLLLFAAHTTVACPLTYDHEAMELFISSMTAQHLENGGSDINQAMQFLMKDVNAPKNIKDPKKLLLVLSDGEFESAPEGPLLSNIKKKFIINALVVGTSNGAYIPTPNGYKRDKKGKLVTSKINLTNMEALAVATGGKANILQDINISSQNFIHESQKLQQKFNGYKQLNVTSNKYYYFLILAFLLIIFDGISTLKIITI